MKASTTIALPVDFSYPYEVNRADDGTTVCGRECKILNDNGVTVSSDEHLFNLLAAAWLGLPLEWFKDMIY